MRAFLPVEIEDAKDAIKVTCIISHIDGHSERTAMTAEKDSTGMKNNIQAKGSTITYLQRYTLIGALGISSASTDIDGQIENIQTPVKKSFDPNQAVIGFGKYAGTKYRDLPEDYLQWLADNARPDEQEKVRMLREYLAKIPAFQPVATEQKPAA